MKPVRVLTKQTESAKMVIEQLRTCTHAWIAVAWATKNDVFAELFKQEGKLKRVVIGTHGCITHPDCIERLAYKNWASIRSAKGNLFHPKLYLFEHPDRFMAIVGSHNLTQGAFGSNIELSTATEFDKDAPAVEALRNFVENEAKGNCIDPTEAFRSWYRDSHGIARTQRAGMDELFEEAPDREEEQKRMAMPIYVAWDAWLKKVDENDVHGRRRRLRTLKEFKRLLGTPGGFRSLEKLDRFRLAGLSTERPKTDDDIDWNFFGEMNKTRQFRQIYASLVEKDDPVEIARALDVLPADTAIPIQRSHWLAFLDALREATEGEGGIGISGATRLACVRRPDTFVPVTGANIELLAHELGSTEGKLKKLENYWDEVVDVIRHTPWWREPHPSGPTSSEDVATWEARAAMLDAIVYRKK